MSDRAGTSPHRTGSRGGSGRGRRDRPTAPGGSLRKRRLLPDGAVAGTRHVSPRGCGPRRASPRWLSVCSAAQRQVGLPQAPRAAAAQSVRASGCRGHPGQGTMCAGADGRLPHFCPGGGAAGRRDSPAGWALCPAPSLSSLWAQGTERGCASARVRGRCEGAGVFVSMQVRV